MKAVTVRVGVGSGGVDGTRTVMFVCWRLGPKQSSSCLLSVLQ